MKNNQQDTEYAIGIDLGTTFSSVSVFKDGKVIVIPDEHGSTFTPSYVSFTEHRRLIGQEAKKQSFKNAKNTIYDSKRLLARKLSDKSVQEDIRYWPFKIEADEFDIPQILVNFKGE